MYEFEDVANVLEGWFESDECKAVRHMQFSFRTKTGAHITVQFNRNPRLPDDAKGEPR